VGRLGKHLISWPLQQMCFSLRSIGNTPATSPNTQYWHSSLDSQSRATRANGTVYRAGKGRHGQ
jgi:hypothetical protein